MNARKAIIPIFTAGIFIFIVFAQLIRTPKPVWASVITNQKDQKSETKIEHQLSLSSSFPVEIQQWRSEIEMAANENNLDPNLIAAIILQESNGDSQAYSSSGAVGLMQVMPHNGIASNFLCDNHPCFQDRPSITELYDPTFNINYGSRMLAGLINKFDNIRKALKAYGPMDIGYQYADIVLGIFQEFNKPE